MNYVIKISVGEDEFYYAGEPLANSVKISKSRATIFDNLQTAHSTLRCLLDSNWYNRLVKGVDELTLNIHEIGGHLV